MTSESEIAKWRSAYKSQKSRAKSRGIEWQFTFDSWLEWWGEDIHRRGVGTSQLCMQRVADSGPYAPWNVRKGVPLWNARTRGRMVRARRSEAARQSIYAAEMAAPCAPSHEEPDEQGEYADLGYRTCEAWS